MVTISIALRSPNLFFRHVAVVFMLLEVKIKELLSAGLAHVSVVVAEVRVTQRSIHCDSVCRMELQHLLHEIQRYINRAIEFNSISMKGRKSMHCLRTLRIDARRKEAGEGRSGDVGQLTENPQSHLRGDEVLLLKAGMT